jgi:hypothetical protein
LAKILTLCHRGKFMIVYAPYEDKYAGGGWGGDVSREIPKQLVDYFGELDKWAIANKREAGKDLVAFWLLKIPAIVTSASAGILGHFSLTTVSIIAGAIASVCVIIDGVHPRGMLRNTHLRAYHDIRMLSAKMLSKWRSRKLTIKQENVVIEIVRDADPERERIATYIRDAETSLRVDTRTESP